MKNYILWISALILTSCAEEKHDFVYGEYKEIIYMDGELDDDLYDILHPDIYDGNVFNDTLYLTHSKYGLLGANKSCAIDTGYYRKEVLAIPLNKRYNELLETYKSISTSHYVLSKDDPPNAIRVDTCIRENTQNRYKFSVTEDYIQIVYCNDGTQDCNPKQALVKHYLRPVKSEQTKN